jgi:hypothetical protein
MRIKRNGFLQWGSVCALAVSALFVVMGMQAPRAGAQSTAAGAENSAKRALDPAAVKAHADPDVTQQRQEASENDTPRGQFKTYHSNLTGSALAQDVPQTFYCRSLTGHAWSRCYYYAGGQSAVVVVGTTSSAQANEAIMITAMGAQGLAQAK